MICINGIAFAFTGITQYTSAKAKYDKRKMKKCMRAIFMGFLGIFFSILFWNLYRIGLRTNDSASTVEKQINIVEICENAFSPAAINSAFRSITGGILIALLIILGLLAISFLIRRIVEKAMGQIEKK